jgi:hypothetical protein
MTEKEPEVVASDLVETIVSQQLLKLNREDLLASCGCGGGCKIVVTTTGGEN